ncbi:PREDICTED: inositol monophosphatase 2-like [Eufriesea mexicana]|uniref:inositol monophosphatase 2-like n=1 Tax=Eufriesea mexicana TaxID=516756 RepID=UPI00083BD73F|nr:PREDICTED: inositol monophosphatase 2-like [Eufriesea mexicana]
MLEIRGSRHAVRAFNRSVALSKASASVIMSSELDIRNYFEFAKELALKAGEIFKCGFEGQKIVESKEHIWDLVTDYDKKIEDALIQNLKTKFPDHEFIGEETTATDKKKPELTDKPTWIIDPIDGTLNYIHSHPYTCISIALAICKELVIGIIYNPLTSELYTAMKGQGAFLNDKPIKTSNATELKNSLIELEVFSLQVTNTKNRDIRWGRLEAFIENTQAIRYSGSAALALAFVARGALDCLYMDRLQPWDVAAGVLIIREAGGSVVDTKEEEYDVMKPSTIAAANEKLAKDIKQFIINTDLKVLRKRLTRT